MSAAIEFRDVSLATSEGRQLLDGVSLALAPGTTTVLLGRSGAGKTTLLRTVNRMIAPTGGEVLVAGKPVAAEDPVALRRGIGYVIQETGVFPHFTVERNVGLVLEATGRPGEERRERSRALLHSVGLDPAIFADRFPHQLSGGQKQRVGLARALAADPKILLMDEPFGALDPLTRGEILEMLGGLLGAMRKTVVLVTHNLQEGLYLGDRIVLMADGRVIADLARDQFLGSSQPEVEAYVHAFERGQGDPGGMRRC